MIIPTMRPGVIEEFIRILPEGISILPLFNNIRTGTHAELLAAKDAFEARVKDLAEVGVDVIHPAGAPPFMVHGFAGEKKIIDGWIEKYKIPMFTTGQNDCDALRARRQAVRGISYFTEDSTRCSSSTSTTPVSTASRSGIGVPFDKMQSCADRDLPLRARNLPQAPETSRHLLCSGRGGPLGILDMIEQDFGVPAVSRSPRSHGACRNACTSANPAPAWLLEMLVRRVRLEGCVCRPRRTGNLS